MPDKSITLAVDMYGCPNRCKHCWLGHFPNKKMDEGIDEWLVDYFKDYYSSVTYYSWLREPDFCSDYRDRWIKDCTLSIGNKPRRFELASFYRIVRDKDYVSFLKELGVKTVQLTFFGSEATTDFFVGRKGAYQELLQATEILINNQISPRFQAILYENNKDEVAGLIYLTEKLNLSERCSSFGGEFKFFVHSGSCDGENEKLYNKRINKNDIPECLQQYILDFKNLLSEQECCEILKNDNSFYVPHNDKETILYISNELDVFFNFTHMRQEWKIGNLKKASKNTVLDKIAKEQVPALEIARKTPLSQMVKLYGDCSSQKCFYLTDYKMYLLNKCARDMLLAEEEPIR